MRTSGHQACGVALALALLLSLSACRSDGSNLRGLCQVEWLGGAMPTEVLPNSYYRVPLRLRNEGTATWVRGGGLRIKYDLYDKSGRQAVRLGNDQTTMSSSVPPGGEIALNVLVRTPEQPGEYTVRFDVVGLSVTAFEKVGNRTLALPFTVVPEVGVVTRNPSRSVAF